MFKDSFKYYKSRNPYPDLKDVIDLNNPGSNKVISFRGKLFDERCEHELGLKPVKDWEIFKFLDVPGLIFIKNPFTTYGQRYWIIKCLKEYSRKPYKLNLDVHKVLNDDEDWWDICFGNSNKGKELLAKLRWATLGYHHNWDTKLYSETCKTEIPTELSVLTSYVAKILDFKDFKAEAAIVNYYRMNSTLAGHTDHSEVNVDAPLFSISFGQTAIFLIGGLTQDDAANAMFLRSGDIVVMSGNSRLRYHGVPKILSATTTPWDSEDSYDNNQDCTWDQDDWNKAKTYTSEARINMNI
ncbi:Alkylated DNA repair protein alkB like protein 1 [Habropoda laboriosa]|uniref:Alkylated DNA repair protein alkB like protein 1 n=1 Tax=Habropoda laboriosa TaxID=597456 RepID=A0A0L7QRH1_9HYME|nr:PREDICTED: DNA demethylase ALKBH1 [Habropoda laboriosa]KOC61223.1 Alkylated DNA repair protein alkB like protein 1 [Habropoda laboriosa]